MYIYYVLSIDLEADFTIMKKQKLLHSWSSSQSWSLYSSGNVIKIKMKNRLCSVLNTKRGRQLRERDIKCVCCNCYLVYLLSVCISHLNCKLYIAHLFYSPVKTRYSTAPDTQ